MIIQIMHSQTNTYTFYIFHDYSMIHITYITMFRRLMLSPRSNFQCCYDREYAFHRVFLSEKRINMIPQFSVIINLEIKFLVL